MAWTAKVRVETEVELMGLSYTADTTVVSGAVWLLGAGVARGLIDQDDAIGEAACPWDRKRPTARAAPRPKARIERYHLLLIFFLLCTRQTMSLSSSAAAALDGRDCLYEVNQEISHSAPNSFERPSVRRTCGEVACIKRGQGI
jgi:hypothetical protein